MYTCMLHVHEDIAAIFYPFSQFCEINISLLSLQKQPNAAPNLFDRGGRIRQVWRRWRGGSPGKSSPSRTPRIRTA